MSQLITVDLKGHSFKFRTKPGVFSAQGIDAGTKLLLDNIEVTDKTIIADLGSGIGLVGIVCGKLNPFGHIHLLDDHLRSKELANENVILNGLTNVEIYLSDLFSAVSSRTYHQIITNPPQQMGNEFLEEIVRESWTHLKQNGWVWVVVKSNIKNVLVRLLETQFRNHTLVAQNREYIVIKSQKVV